MKSSIFITAFFLLFASCKQFTGIPDDFDYGKIENNIYTNNFFGFKFPVNNGWEALNKMYLDSLRSEGLKQISDGNPELEKSFETSEIKTANLVSLIKVDTVLFQMYSANLAFIAENLKLAIHIKDGKSYLESAQKYMLKSGINAEIVGPITEYEIGKKKFFTMEVVNEYSGMEVHQDFYAIIINGFGLSFIGSWVNDEQRESIRQMLTEITFY